MSPGFRLAAVRQASTGSSESCQDCFQYIRQSLMENQGYCEDTREDHVPSQAKRYSHTGTVHHYLPASDKSNTFQALWTALLTLMQLRAVALRGSHYECRKALCVFFFFSYFVESFTCRQKVCSQASQGKSTACHRGMRQEDLDLGNALHPSEHAPEYSQPRQENHPACHLDAMSCKSSAGRLCSCACRS